MVYLPATPPLLAFGDFPLEGFLWCTYLPHPLSHFQELPPFPVYGCYIFTLQESEHFLSQLVTNKTIFARIDRPAGLVSFRESKDPSDVLNDWSQNLNSLMTLVGKTTHLINKEEMVHALVK